jgi:intergrase/recombinase
VPATSKPRAAGIPSLAKSARARIKKRRVTKMNEEELRRHLTKQLDNYKAESERINRAYRDNLNQIYEQQTEALERDYRQFVGKVGIISALAGVLVGLIVATLVEVIFG